MACTSTHLSAAVHIANAAANMSDNIAWIFFFPFVSFRDKVQKIKTVYLANDLL